MNRSLSLIAASSPSKAHQFSARSAKSAIPSPDSENRAVELQPAKPIGLFLHPWQPQVQSAVQPCSRSRVLIGGSDIGAVQTEGRHEQMSEHGDIGSGVVGTEVDEFATDGEGFFRHRLAIVGQMLRVQRDHEQGGIIEAASHRDRLTGIQVAARVGLGLVEFGRERGEGPAPQVAVCVRKARQHAFQPADDVDLDLVELAKQPEGGRVERKQGAIARFVIAQQVGGENSPVACLPGADSVTGVHLGLQPCHQKLDP